MKNFLLFTLSICSITIESYAVNLDTYIVAEDSITDKKLLRQQKKEEQIEKKNLILQQKQAKDDSIKQAKENRRNEKLNQKENKQIEKNNKRIQDSLEKANKKIEKQNKQYSNSTDYDSHQNNNHTGISSSSKSTVDLKDDFSTYNNSSDDNIKNETSHKATTSSVKPFTDDSTYNIIFLLLIIFVPHIIIQITKSILAHLIFGEKCPHCKNRKVRVVSETDLGITKQDIEYHKDSNGRDTSKIKSIQNYHRYRVDKYCTICNHEFSTEVERKG